jgi:hypothetical protein
MKAITLLSILTIIGLSQAKVTLSFNADPLKSLKGYA